MHMHKLVIMTTVKKASLFKTNCKILDRTKSTTPLGYPDQSPRAPTKATRLNDPTSTRTLHSTLVLGGT